MEKEFNVTGTCIPEMHYMVDISRKLDNTISLISKGKYFVINRPRQYGKTTTLYLLDKKLNEMEEYLPIKISFEAIDTESYSDVKKFLNSVMSLIIKYFRFSTNKEVYRYIKNKADSINTMSEFSNFITDFIEFTEKKVILIIDEVDKSSNNQLFLDFLGMLRDKYLLRNEGKDYTFQSVILAGVHDVKSLKLKIRSDEEKKYNSPWNIASDFDVDMSFSVEEIETMLDDYVENKSIDLDKAYFAERLYFYTSGYPFLVSKLCKIIDEKIMKLNELKWEKQYLDIAVKQLLNEGNTNFDSLIKNIENNSELKSLVKRIILDGTVITYNEDNFTITMAIRYGIFTNYHGKVKVHNRIYEQRIYNYFSSLMETSTDVAYYNEAVKFINSNGDLDVEKILIKFQEFMKHEYSEKREAFLEADGRILFLAFISPIINGVGFAFKEVQGGDEKRFDIVITYNNKMYILELKICTDKKSAERNQDTFTSKNGLIQLGEYLNQYSLDTGYLLIFDFRKTDNLAGEMQSTNIEVEGKNKRILEVYC